MPEQIKEVLGETENQHSLPVSLAICGIWSCALQLASPAIIAQLPYAFGCGSLDIKCDDFDCGGRRVGPQTDDSAVQSNCAQRMKHVGFLGEGAILCATPQQLILVPLKAEGRSSFV